MRSVDEPEQEPGYNRLFGLLLIGCVVQAIVGVNWLTGRSPWTFAALLVVTALLAFVSAAYVSEQGRHPCWGLLGVLNLLGLMLLIILPEAETSAESTRRGFGVIRVAPAMPNARAPRERSDMRITVKLFAILRERADGTSELSVQLRAGATVADALTTLGDRFPELRSFLPRVAYAVNQTT
jgi:molybdopterin converting factor small subunit